LPIIFFQWVVGLFEEENKSKDKYFILYDKSIVVVQQIKKHSSGEVTLEVCKFNRSFQMSNNPICSTTVGCFYVLTDNISIQFQIKLDQIKFKCFFIPTSDSKAVVISLLHTCTE